MQKKKLEKWYNLIGKSIYKFFLPGFVALLTAWMFATYIEREFKPYVWEYFKLPVVIWLVVLIGLILIRAMIKKKMNRR